MAWDDEALTFLHDHSMLDLQDPGAGRVGQIDAETEDVYPLDIDLLLRPPTSQQTPTSFALADDIDGPISGEIGAALGAEQSTNLADRAERNPWDGDCAWYAPLHFFGDAWGIYVRERCVEQIAAEIGWFVDPDEGAVSADSLRLAALLMLLLHEHFHHKVESAAIRMAVVDRQPPGFYRRYDLKVYNPALGTDALLEEALANADAYNRLGEPTYRALVADRLVEPVRRWMRWRFEYVDPPGYRVASQFLTTSRFKVGARLLQEQLRTAMPAPSTSARCWAAAPNMLRSSSPLTPKIYLIIPIGATPRFPAAGRPFCASVPELHRWLQNNGFVKIPGRGRGDHQIYEHTERSITVSVDGADHRNARLTYRVESSIAAAIGISARQLRTAVKFGTPLDALLPQPTGM